MAIPKGLEREDIIKAAKYIDENSIPDKHLKTKYKMILDSGKKYPPKYIIAVANHLVNGVEISVGEFDGTEAWKFLEKTGFAIEANVDAQEKFELIITKDSITSTDNRFTMDDLGLGNNYVPMDSYFKKYDGEEIRRTYRKGERRNSNQTLPRLAAQIFEQSIIQLTDKEKEDFPICQYTPSNEVIRGIYSSVEEFKKVRNSIEYTVYTFGEGNQFIFYSWNIFSTVIFTQECLKRFGTEGDKFVLTYREKDIKEEVKSEIEETLKEEQVMEFSSSKNPYSNNLVESKNIIFRGAPGTGKSYLAKKIAADIVSNGYTDSYSALSDEQKRQVEFVQFHPSYDYTDFVEGLRPTMNDDGTMGFQLQDGVFKRFVTRARKNFVNSQKSQEVIEKEANVQNIITDYFSSIEIGEDSLEIASGKLFYIVSISEEHIYISVPENKVSSKLKLNISDIEKMLESGQPFTQVKDVTQFFGKINGTQHYSYYLAIVNAIKAKETLIPNPATKPEKLKRFVFIIDEINRGEISKIFGELFFSIDPGYRGQDGEISTQYANLHDNPEIKFYIPENVYIIGTMNDIDRSVDSFDFAMRRRFRFIEIKADEQLEMLDCLGENKNEAIRRLTALNVEISAVEDLNENYHIGPSYFLKLDVLSFDQLWTDYLLPLLQDYVRGMYDEEKIMNNFADAYGYVKPEIGSPDE